MKEMLSWLECLSLSLRIQNSEVVSISPCAAAIFLARSAEC
jgi:hypothetical protein